MVDTSCMDDPKEKQSLFKLRDLTDEEMIACIKFFDKHQVNMTIRRSLMSQILHTLKGIGRMKTRGGSHEDAICKVRVQILGGLNDFFGQEDRGNKGTIQALFLTLLYGKTFTIAFLDELLNLMTPYTISNIKKEKNKI